MSSLVSVPLSNEPGALAKLTMVLSAGNVGIDGVEVHAKGSKAEALFLVKDPDKCVSVLQKGGYPSKVTPVHVITLSNHTGALTDVCMRLARAGINIEALFGTTYGKAGTVALVTNDNASAAKVLDQLSL